MKKLLLGLMLALTTLSLSNAQTPQPTPPKKLTVRQAQAQDSVRRRYPLMQTNFPLPEYNPWPWEYQLPHLFM
jgi:hypothetical protein